MIKGKDGHMDWISILGIVFGSGGFVTAFVSLMKARSTVKNEEVSRLLTTIEGLQKRCDTLDKDFTEYKAAAEKMIAENRERNRLLDMRIDIMTKALNSAFRCQKVQNPMDCVALATLKDLCDKNEGICSIAI